MKLSIIIPVYNVENYIQECIESILNQGLSYDEFEVILVNDGSTDGSKNLCESIVSENFNIKLINQKNKGQSSARNKGLELAKGDFIFFIDADDYLKPNYLKELLEIIEQNSLDFLGFECELTKKRFNISLSPQKLELVVKGNGFQLLENYNYNNGPWWYIFKKSILDDLAFEEDRLCEDGIFTAQLIQKVSKGEIYNNKIYCYFENPTSTVKTTNKERNKKINRDMFYAANKFKDIIELLPDKSKKNKAFLRLKHRQESYTFFALVRFLKSKQSFDKITLTLNKLSEGKYPAYPIKTFDGYGVLKNKILISLFNQKWSLKFLIGINKFLNIIK